MKVKYNSFSKFRWLITLCLIWIATCSTMGSSRIKTFDIQNFIDTELGKGVKTIVIPKGQYKVIPTNRQHLLLQNLKDVTIDATGVEMICTQTTRAITINKCENVTIKGLTIDYDPLCFTEGEIVGLSADKSSMDVRVFDGYSDNLTSKLEIFNPNTQLLRRHTYYGWQQPEKNGKKNFRLKKATNYKYNPDLDLEQVGDVVVFNSIYAPDGAIPHAIYSDYCTNLRLDNITIYSGPTFAFFETNGTSNTYYKCTVDRCSVNSDYIKREMRYRSNNADAFHSKYAFIGPKIVECSAQYQGDDGVNICGKYYFVVRAQADKLYIISHNDMDLTLTSIVDGITSSGTRIPRQKVLGINEVGYLTTDEKDRIKKCYLHENIKKQLLETTVKVYEVTLNTKVSVDFGTIISDANRQGNGFEVQNCNFSNNRSRGILIKASNGVVEGNTLTGNWLQSILVSPEAFWLESGCSDNVEIRNNTIVDNQSKECILIDATCMNKKTPPVGIHENITITGNKIENCLSPAIKCVSVKGLILENNTYNNQPLDAKENIRLLNCNSY